MSKRKEDRAPPRPRNPMAMALESPIYRKRIVDKKREGHVVRCKASLRRRLIGDAPAGWLCGGQKGTRDLHDGAFPA